MALEGTVELPPGVSFDQVVVSVGGVLEAKVDAEGKFGLPPSPEIELIFEAAEPFSVDVMSADKSNVLLSSTLFPGERVIAIDSMSMALSQTCNSFFVANPTRSLWERAAELPAMKELAAFIRKNGFTGDEDYQQLLKTARQAVGEMQAKPASMPKSNFSLPDPFPKLKPNQELFSRQWPAKSADEKQVFLADNRVEPGLAASVSPGTMAASWFRLSYVLAAEYSELGFLFSRSLREEITSGPGNDLSRNLYNLFKVYYHAGMKYDYGDQKTFATLENSYGDSITEEAGVRVFSGDGVKVRWCLEDGAWRLDSIVR